MLYIFEMANNHQGSVEHAKLIIDKFSNIAKQKNINAAVKLQFRQLDTFIHDEFKHSDLKYVKRFNSTRLSRDQFYEIVRYIKDSGLTPIATPFDNESLSWFEEFDIPIIKIASCSIDDYPLLNEVSKINRKIILSTAGASMGTLIKIYSLMKKNSRDFAFMHCVGEYPTPPENSNLSRINELRQQFPDIEIGFSTHESPLVESLAPTAVAMGCTILEKHVGVATDNISLNAYSNTPEQMSKVIDSVKLIQSALDGKSTKEHDSLLSLKRGIYAARELEVGEIIKAEDLYYAMPCQDGQFNASDYYKVVGLSVTKKISVNEQVKSESLQDESEKKIVNNIVESATKILKSANVSLFGKEKVEISAHYGIKHFFQHGALIIDKINREYCKKIIVVMPGQKHPSHKHIRKEEAFELLHGDCTLTLNGKEIKMVKGKPILIGRGVFHSFKSKDGCVIEEISTTHYSGDSIYSDAYINSLKISERKIKTKLINI